MTKRDAQRLIKKSGRQVSFYWQGDTLIRSCWDKHVQAWREDVEGNCYECSRLQAEREAWISEVADISG